MKVQTYGTGVLFLALLAGCGGGGTAATTPVTPPTPTPPPVVNDPGLVLTPGSLSLASYAGESQTLSIDALAKRDFPGTINVQVSDTGKLLATVDEVRAWNAHSYTATISTSAALPAGSYDGNLNIALCKDSATVCQQQHDGSPWKLPYHLEVKNFATASGQTALSAIAGMGEWGIYQGGLAHTGFAPATVASSSITPRFFWNAQPTFKSNSASRSAVVSENGVAYTSIYLANSLFALDEQTGAQLWQYKLSDSALTLGYPAVSQGKVFLPMGGNSGKLLILNAKTGALEKTMAINDISAFIAPTVEGNTVHVRVNGGAVAAYDYTTGRLLYSNSNHSSSNWFSPFALALDQNFAYYYNSGTAFQIDRTSGTITRQIATQRTQYNDAYANNIGSLVLYGPQQAVFNEQILYGEGDGTASLFNMDFSTGTTKWTVAGKFLGNPVLNGDTLYAVNGADVAALRMQDGGKAWSWPIPAADIENGAARFHNMVLTNNLLFVSFEKHAYAIDLATHQTVWTFERGGPMTLSRNGVLYLNGSTGLFAFNVK